MLLALDVGNSNIVLAVYDVDRLVADWRISTERDRTSDEYGILLTELLGHRGIDAAGINGIAVSTVVPTMNDTLAGLARDYFDSEPLMVGPDTDFGIAIHYQPAADVGADRLCNAVGAHAKYGGPAIVVDFGTSTNFDVIAH